jgi:hypothetical protein
MADVLLEKNYACRFADGSKRSHFQQSFPNLDIWLLFNVTSFLQTDLAGVYEYRFKTTEVNGTEIRLK